jgi:excisionase family DNA binding protein
MPSDQKGWLSLTEASKVLGVHQTTLRRWADSGSIPCFRTPGGHRRFRAGDLEAWMTGRQTMALAPHTTALVENVVGFTRHEMVERHVSQEAWYVAFDRNGDRQHMRETGHRLMGLAIQYIGRTSNHKPAIQEGRRLGGFYGQQCAEHGVSLLDTMRAFFFFRESLLRATRPGLVAGDQYDAEDVRIHQQLQFFLNEVMYACLASYEAACRRLLRAENAT